MALPPLTQVDGTLRSASPVVASLPHVVDALSALLDTSTGVSLPTAAASGSVRLLSRVAARAETVKPALRAHLFARAMKIAITNNDLPMVQQIHSFHAEPLVVPSLELAAEHGSLELVQWVATHRNDQSCCSPGLQNLCPHVASQMLAHVGPQDALPVVCWLVEDGGPSLAEVWGGGFDPSFLRTCVRDLELVRWLVEDNNLKPGNINRVLWLAIERPDSTIETVRYLVEQHLANKTKFEAETAQKPRGFLLVDDSFVISLFIASLQRGKEETVEFLLTTPLADSLRDKVVYEAIRPEAAKVLQWTREVLDDVARSPGRTLKNLGLRVRAAQYCHVETLRWLHKAQGSIGVDSKFDSSVTEQDVLELFTWMLEVGIRADSWPHKHTNRLATRGFLTAAKWLHDHGVGGVTAKTMDLAAANGHLDFVQWLHQRRQGCTGAAMNGAAGHGHLNVVKWLHEQGYERNATFAMTWAAVGGHVDVLEWLHENRPDGCVFCALRGLLRIPRAYVHPDGISSTFPVLNTLQWLDEHQPATPDCRGVCLPALPTRTPYVLCHLTSIAVAAGNMALLEYLHEHHREEFALNRASPHAAATAIVQRGCLTSVKWLYEHHHGDFDWNLAIRLSRFKRVQEWLLTVMDQA